MTMSTVKLTSVKARLTPGGLFIQTSESQYESLKNVYRNQDQEIPKLHMMRIYEAFENEKMLVFTGTCSPIQLDEFIAKMRSHIDEVLTMKLIAIEEARINAEKLQHGRMVQTVIEKL